ncbi:MAG: YlxM family DNA-binding protein [Clostridiales bacterium]|nr:YlxM family DNA-binding protein [Clostridiales bacterium]
MAKDLSISVLMDFYGQLLTDKRYDALDMYYNQDLSLGEIAGELGISRQGVRDNIKHAEAQLAQLEEKLGLAKRFSDILADIDEMEKIISGMEKNSETEQLLETVRHIASKI